MKNFFRGVRVGINIIMLLMPLVQAIAAVYVTVFKDQIVIGLLFLVISITLSTNNTVDGTLDRILDDIYGDNGQE